MHRSTALLLALAAAPLAAGPLAAQAAAPAAPRAAKAAQPAAGVVARAAATITEQDVRRRIGIIADDSMQGRDTPSRGLDLTAQYLADEYKRLGLKPAGENGTYFQRYPITMRALVPEQSTLTIVHGAMRATLRFDRDAVFQRGGVPEGALTLPLVVVGGGITPEAAAKLPLDGKAVVYVADYQGDAAASQRRTQVMRALAAAGPKALVLMGNRDSTAFAPLLRMQARPRTVIDLGEPPRLVVEARDAAMPAEARAHFAKIRAMSEPLVEVLPADSARLEVRMQEAVQSSTTAPNVVAVLEGSDPKLKHEYVVLSAHMDHVGTAAGGHGCAAKGADSICNGADDDASGTVGVVELAEAFATKGLRTKRSLLFLNVSGEEKGLWGSRYFSEHPTVPLKDVVADLNMDMIGRNWPDTIVAIGKEHSDLGATLNRVNAAHPELGMTAIDDKWPEERFYFRSDHYNFARKGVPILFFFNGVHPDYHQVGDSPDKIDAEKEARIVKLVFYLTHDIANAPARPQWNPESYKEIAEGPGGR
ncbi:MAG TPA: M20/M25/M40 family metallo-hydrolase [Gemmatimonadales bacterium]|nr:M20/M25/M40 family metallo-hydrolase [Gemmatimonadales bacterium]